MKDKKFVILIKVKDKIIFSNENNPKEIENWINAYQKNNLAEEIKVYERIPESKVYSLLFSDCRRKIGF